MSPQTVYDSNSWTSNYGIFIDHQLLKLTHRGGGNISGYLTALAVQQIVHQLISSSAFFSALIYGPVIVSAATLPLLLFSDIDKCDLTEKKPNVSM